MVGPLLLAANLGTRGVPTVDLGPLELNDVLWYKAGAGYELREGTGLTAELAGGLTYSAFFNAPASPLEAQLGFYAPVGRGMQARAFAGTGLTSGVGSPSWRAGVSFFYYNDPSQDSDLDGIPDNQDACIKSPEDYDDWEDSDGCPDWDNDDDGLTDAEDACPIDPEDFDQYEDKDGCPEGNAAVTVELVTPDGEPVLMPRVKLVPRVGDPVEMVKTPSTKDLASGTWLLEASAEGMLPLQKSFDVPEEGGMVIREVMQPEAKQGTLTVKITEPDGKPLPGTWKLDDLSYEYGATGGTGTREVIAGRHVVTARAPNFAPSKVDVDVPANGEIEVVIVLNPSKVKVSRERIDVNGKIYFEFDSAEIKKESYPLLDEVAQILIDHPELTKLLIEGHTDSKGSDAYNLKLSDDRAMSVMNYLVVAGVNPSRLESKGFGETEPIADNGTEAGREKNRRVVFRITERSDD
ncbi:MAG: OmpA family protein [Alphaproteobacteria bacterium]|nr:OmpA family protein [Alphaproteobacteria bacterium]MCB9792099.1 OmpA family protein [Alphaproteobacteria bacterium]